MDEVIFKKIKRTGVLNLAMGIVAVVAGITTGVLHSFRRKAFST